MVLLSLGGALRNALDFLRDLVAREELARDEAADAPPSVRFMGWLVAREELGGEGGRPRRGGSFLVWLLGREELGGEAIDEEASDE